MKKHFGGLLCVLLILSIATISWKPAKLNKVKRNFKKEFTAKELLNRYIGNIYESAHLQQSGMDYEVFKKAVTGFIDLKIANKISPYCTVLTVVDLAKSSCEKRMWIVDVISKELLLNTWTAHGEGSGDDRATRFSDRDDSHQSSLGFYITDDVYYGKNGRSLKLDGMDAGFNGSARARAIVLHGAGYVSQGTIDHLGRLGHSYGCPAVAREVADQVINTIKNKTVLFVSGNDYRYSSKYLDEELAANYVAPDANAGVMASL